VIDHSLIRQQALRNRQRMDQAPNLEPIDFIRQELAEEAKKARELAEAYAKSKDA
jgi:hypothetical protein